MARYCQRPGKMDHQAVCVRPPPRRQNRAGTWATAPRAVFIAVNVKPYFRGVADVSAYSQEHQLAAIPSWHFFTGPPASLKTAWRAYDISVEAPSRNADVIHTSEVIFIDARGRERYVAEPMADYTAKGSAYLPAGPLAEWGHGIAQVARAIGR
jgi:cytochrome oxidase Cu insertion factor (SCO1/SenC/PrrC family)